MPDSAERTSEEPLMPKDEDEDEDEEWLWSSKKHRPQSKRKWSSLMLTVAPWALLIMLGSWDLIRYLRSHTKEIFNPAQQIYSLLTSNLGNAYSADNN